MSEPTVEVLPAGSLTIAQPYYCPVCGYECTGGLEFTLQDPEIDGHWCLRCWAKKTTEGVPRLVKK